MKMSNVFQVDELVSMTPEEAMSRINVDEKYINKYESINPKRLPWPLNIQKPFEQEVISGSQVIDTLKIASWIYSFNFLSCLEYAT
jgi:hypothetical protein